MTEKCIPIAHRGVQIWKGMPVAPENTLPAFELVKSHNIPVVEFDVQRSKDGALVVIHDVTVDRTTNQKGLVARMSLEQLQRCNAAAQFSKMPHCQIPTLEEVFEVLSPSEGARTRLNIELKSPGIAFAVAELIESSLGLWDIGDFLVSSFHHDELFAFRNRLPEIEIGALYADLQCGASDPIRRVVEDLRALKAEYFNANADLFCDRPEDVSAILEATGVKALAYTPRNSTEVNALLEFGVDGMFLNDPSLLQSSS